MNVINDTEISSSNKRVSRISTLVNDSCWFGQLQNMNIPFLQTFQVLFIQLLQSFLCPASSLKVLNKYTKHLISSNCRIYFLRIVTHKNSEALIGHFRHLSLSCLSTTPWGLINVFPENWLRYSFVVQN